MANSRLTFELYGRDNASPVFDQFGKRVDDTHKRLSLLEGASRKLVGAAAGYVAFDRAADFLRAANEEARESQKVNALTAAVLKSTGNTANTSAVEIGALATKLSMKTAIDDEQIQTSTNLLLTFKAVRNEVGEGAKILDRATEAALDLSAAGFGSTESSAKMLGKALNDPLKGISALSRAGVTFTDGQKEQIKSLVEQNDLLGAQKIILREVESQVKGSAASQATAAEKAEVAWANVKETIGTALLPTIDRASEKFVDFVESHDIEGWAERGAVKLENFGAAMAPLAKDVLPAVGTALSIAADGAERLAPAVGEVVEAFNSMPTWAQTALVGGGAAAMVLPTPSRRDKMPKSDRGSDGGSGRNTKNGTGGGLLKAAAAVPPLMWGADQLGAALDAVGDGSADVDRLAASFDRAGKATETTGMILDRAFADGSVGRHAEELGINVDDLSRSLANAGSGGKVYRDTLADIDKRMVDLAKAGDIGDEFFALKDFRRQLTEVASSTDDARGSARGLAAVLGLVGDKAETGSHALDALGEKRARPEIRLKGVGPSLGSIGRVVDGMLGLDQTPANPRIRPNGVGSSMGSIGRVVDRMLLLDGTTASPRVAPLGIASTLYGLEAIANRISILNNTTLTTPSGGDRRRASGGAILGPGSGTSDDVLVRSSNGEHMLPANEVELMGGQSAVYEWRRRLREGRGEALAGTTPAASAGPRGSRVESDLERQRSSARLREAQTTNQLLRDLVDAVRRGDGGKSLRTMWPGS